MSDSNRTGPRAAMRRQEDLGAAGHPAAELWDWFRSIAVALLLVVLVNRFAFTQARVEGGSMQPTLQSGERLLVNRLAYAWSSPARGDIVVLRDPDHTGVSDYLVKRVAAVGGDFIEFRKGIVYVNGTRLDERYPETTWPEENAGPFWIAQDYVYVLGDNHLEGRSRDSRYFGAVPVSSVIGEAAGIVWPLSRVRRL